MIDAFDETLRRLLVRELPIKKNEIDIKFDQPNREWSAKLSRPTLNFFLYDMRENTRLRPQSPQWVPTPVSEKEVSLNRRPIRVDLFYAATAWARDPEDEHRLLTRTLMAFFRNPFVPEDLLSENLQDQPVPIAIEVAQNNALQNPSDFWSALDNEIRPAIPCVVTMAINPFVPIELPIVSERSLTFLDTDNWQGEETTSAFWTVGGTFHGSTASLRQARLQLLELEQEVDLKRDGTFTIKGLAAGEYTLELTTSDDKVIQKRITVPAPDYEFEL